MFAAAVDAPESGSDAARNAQICRRIRNIVAPAVRLARRVKFVGLACVWLARAVARLELITAWATTFPATESAGASVCSRWRGIPGAGWAAVASPSAANAAPPLSAHDLGRVPSALRTLAPIAAVRSALAFVPCHVRHFDHVLTSRDTPASKSRPSSRLSPLPLPGSTPYGSIASSTTSPSPAKKVHGCEGRLTR